MEVEQRNQRQAEAAAAFDAHERRSDGDRIAASLDDGFTLLRDMFFTRIHVDVEKAFGMDSMLAPVSLIKTEARTKTEIDVYQVTESAAEAGARRYVGSDGDWYRDWLGRLRLGQGLTAPAVAQRLEHYAARSADERRRTFVMLLERTLPQAGRAPLVVYRLLPLAAAIVTAIAFGDHSRAQELRKQQMRALLIIADCRTCHGNLLDNGERCVQCGNPFWKFEWLTAE